MLIKFIQIFYRMGLFKPTRAEKSYHYALALRRDRYRQTLSDSLFLNDLANLGTAKTKKEKNRISKRMEETLKKDKEIHAEMRKILD